MINLPETKRIEIWKEGYKSFESGKRESENPYPSNYGSHFAWSYGWNEAAQDKIDALADELENK